MTAFIAHDIAGWIGLPTAIVVVAMVMLRKWGMAVRARRQTEGQQRTEDKTLAGG